MKNLFLAILASVVLSIASMNPSLASQVREKNSKSSDIIHSTQSAPDTRDTRSSSVDRKMGVGLATAQNMTQTSTALTVWTNLDSVNALQGFLAVGSSNPFQFGVGGLLKHTLSESQGAGFHVGGGVGLGNSQNLTLNSTKFFMSLSGIAGFHFGMPEASKIKIHLDGGATFQLINDTSDFLIGGMSPALGLSIFYLL